MYINVCSQKTSLQQIESNFKNLGLGVHEEGPLFLSQVYTTVIEVLFLGGEITFHLYLPTARQLFVCLYV